MCVCNGCCISHARPPAMFLRLLLISATLNYLCIVKKINWTEPVVHVGKHWRGLKKEVVQGTYRTYLFKVSFFGLILFFIRQMTFKICQYHKSVTSQRAEVTESPKAYFSDFCTRFLEREASKRANVANVRKRRRPNRL